MNLINSHQASAFILVLVMLLNPILAAAGSMSAVWAPEQVTSAGSSSVDETVKRSSLTQAENCHEHVAKSSVPALTNLGSFDDPSASFASDHSHADCCDGPCMCAQGSCHTPIGATVSSSVLAAMAGNKFLSTSPSYTNPSLSALNPPPII